MLVVSSLVFLHCETCEKPIQGPIFGPSALRTHGHAVWLESYLHYRDRLVRYLNAE